MNNKTEKHHVIPISLHGWDVRENIVVVTKEQHARIHRTLNVPYNYIREFKKKTNHKLFFDKDYFTDLRILHLEYFKRIELLPSDLIDKQTLSMYSQISYIEGMYGVLRSTKIKRVGTNFSFALHLYHDVLYKAVTYQSNK